MIPEIVYNFVVRSFDSICIISKPSKTDVYCLITLFASANVCYYQYLIFILQAHDSLVII